MKTDIQSVYKTKVNEIHARASDMPWEDKMFYATWLAQSYYFVKHSTRLLALASAHANFNENSLHVRMAKHIGEESFHEKLAEKDLSNMGLNISNFQELNETKIFYRNQYFGVENLGSSYLLGYILLLEGFAITTGPMIYERAGMSVSEKALSFVRVHVEEDQDHVEKAIAEISKLESAQLANCVESLEISASIYREMLTATNQLYRKMKSGYSEAREVSV